MDLVEQRRRDLEALDRKFDGGDSLKACWEDFRVLREECLSLFRETLAFMQGASLRRAGLDGGFCQLADGLLDELDRAADLKWGRITIPAEAEFFGDMAQIIRLRFPEVDIWDLPMAVHEFGHFVGPEIAATVKEGLRRRVRYPFQEILDREYARGLRWWYFAHEQFADVFATYALGPAYPCACMLGRFDPGAAHEDGLRHPSAAKRVELTLRTLQRMDDAEALAAPYAGVLSELRKSWRDSLAAAGSRPDVDPAAAEELGRVFNELYSLIDEYLPILRYAGMSRAEELKRTLPGGQPSVGADVTIADILNAAWLCRIDRWDDGPELVHVAGEAATRLCQEVLERRAAEAG